MGVVFMIVLGAIVGWLAAIMLSAENRKGLARNIGWGIAGALCAGLLVSPLMGLGTLLSDRFSITAMVLALGGAVLAIVSVNLLRRTLPR